VKTRRDSLFLFITFLALAVAGFQNCSAVHLGASSDSSSPAPAAGNGGGVPYDGKAYAIHGAVCPDGSSVRSRIVFHAGGRAELVRDNCQNIAPQLIAPGAYAITSGDVLEYNHQMYLPEDFAAFVKPLSTWFYQLTGAPAAPNATIYDLDMFDTSASQIAQLKSAGHTVICYISAGSFENGRPDAGQFPAAALGTVLGGGSSDRWLDTRHSTVRSLMVARLDLALGKGCQGIDFDNVDAFYYNSGFALSSETQLDYNRFLASAAHDRGLFVALNNTPDLAVELAQNFDLVITQQCYQNGDCAKFQPFIELGKAVLDVEYTAYSSAQCSAAKTAQISLVFENQALDGTVYNSCP